MIVRGPRAERDFTIIRNATLRDARLTFKARGLLAFILSQPEGYRVSAEELAEEGPDGRDAIRSALREMEAAGYLRREKRRTKDGRLMTDAVLFEVPLVAENPLQPATGNPSPVRPGLFDESAGQTGDGLTDAGEPGANRRTSDLEGLEKDFSPSAGKPQLLAVASAASPATRKRDPLWDALVAEMGYSPQTKAARGAWNGAVGQLRDTSDCDAEEIAARCAEFRRRWPSVSLTPSALAKHWDALGVRDTAAAAANVPRGWAGIAEARAMRGAR